MSQKQISPYRSFSSIMPSPFRSSETCMPISTILSIVHAFSSISVYGSSMS